MGIDHRMNNVVLNRVNDEPRTHITLYCDEKITVGDGWPPTQYIDVTLGGRSDDGAFLELRYGAKVTSLFDVGWYLVPQPGRVVGPFDSPKDATQLVIDQAAIAECGVGIT